MRERHEEGNERPFSINPPAAKRQCWNVARAKTKNATAPYAKPIRSFNSILVPLSILEDRECRLNQLEQTRPPRPRSDCPQNVGAHPRSGDEAVGRTEKIIAEDWHSSEYESRGSCLFARENTIARLARLALVRRNRGAGFSRQRRLRPAFALPTELIGH